MARWIAATSLLATGLGDCQPKAPADFTTYTAWLIHHQNNPASVTAKNIVRRQFCDKFNVSPCEVSAEAGGLRLIGDVTIAIPRARFVEVVPWLMQQRHARVSGAGHNLDLKLSPVSGCPDLDENEYSLFIGHDYRFNPRTLSGKDVAEGQSLPQPSNSSDDWAFTCSADNNRTEGYNVCVGAPANNTVCDSESQGFHLHTFYSNNDPASEAAKDSFHSQISATFGLNETCPDTYAHEMIHPRSCFLTSPSGEESEYPQAPKAPGAGSRNSFTTGTHSFYICAEERCPGDFTNIVSWLMVYKNADKLGSDITFLLHPTFGCNFADHENWGFRSRLSSVGAGTHVQNNLYGIGESGDYTGEVAPSLDPNSASWPAKVEKFCTASSMVSIFSLHVLYNPEDAAAVNASKSFTDALSAKFAVAVESGDVCMSDADDEAYAQAESPFLTGHVEVGVKRSQLSSVLYWAATNRPVKLDIAVTGDSGCPFADYVKQALWAGSQWPFNEHAFYTGNMTRFSGSCFGTRRSSAETVLADHGDFLLYVQHGPDNLWASQAKEAFLKSFAAEFGVTREACGSDEPPLLEPLMSDLCMMEERADPFYNSTDPNTASYGRIYVPQAKAADVIAWGMQHQAAKASGYAVDTMLVPLSGAPGSDYQEFALRGNSYWAVKQGAFTEHVVMV